jgi:hypothetical protein
MLHKSGKQPCRKTFTMRWDIGIKLWQQDLTLSEVQKDITYAFMNLAEVSQVKLFRQARSPYMGNLMQREGYLCK